MSEEKDCSSVAESAAREAARPDSPHSAGLLPCPFCGGSATVTHQSWGTPRKSYYGVTCDGDCLTFFDCRASSEKRAVAEWNERAPLNGQIAIPVEPFALLFAYCFTPSPDVPKHIRAHPAWPAHHDGRRGALTKLLRPFAERAFAALQNAQPTGAAPKTLSEEGEEGSSRSQPCADAQERSPEARHSGGGRDE